LPRLHPALLVHTARVSGRRRLVAQAWAGRPPLVLKHPAALSALGALPAEFDRDGAFEAWRAAGVPEDAHDGLWAAFGEAGLVVDGQQDARGWWSELGWSEARSYHEATRDYPFLQMDDPGAYARDRERMVRYARQAAGPSPYQHLGGEAVVDLPRLAPGASPDEWLERMSIEDRRSREGVGLLMDVCFGERGRMTVAGGGTSLLKSIPSGGARHPTEVFLAAFDVPGIPEGVYHYDVEHHRLEGVSAGQLREAFARATMDLFARYEAPPVAALVFTSRVERAMWRYRDPRSFRAVLVDVGHAVMAYRHVARALGFRTYAYQKMHDREVAELVGVDPVAQPPLYVGSLVSSPTWKS
jgi:SagB-type dehydrogenase family enzyme